MPNARQLNLFKGKRQRGVAPPTPKEFALHVSLADVLRRWAMPEWIWTHIGHGEKRDSAAAARLYRMGLKPGFPDFIFFAIDGRLAVIELKRRGSGRLSDEQEAVLQHLERAGHKVLVTTSLDQAVDFLKELGVLRAGVHLQ